MEFGFTQTQELFRKTLREFCQRELAPGAKERAKENHFPKDVLKKMAKMGILGLTVPEEYGGQPSDWVSVGIAVEEVARADFNLSILPTLNAGVYLALRLTPKEVQKEWVPPLVAGDILFCIAVTEPEAGSDAAALRTKAIRKSDCYILQGEKTSITLGMQSEGAVLFAKTDPTQRAKGITGFLVPLNLPGISRSRLLDMGCKPMGRATIVLDNVRIPASYRLGEEGQGFYLVMSQFDAIRVCLGLMCLGTAQTSLEGAMEYAKKRYAFGRPIAKFEGIAFKIAEDYTLLEAARLLCYKALWMRDQGMVHIKESAMCKWFCPQVAVRVIHNAILIHGHYGYSEEMPLEQRLRDVIGFEFADGTAEIMKIIISRELLGREYLPY